MFSLPRFTIGEESNIEQKYFINSPLTGFKLPIQKASPRRVLQDGTWWDVKKNSASCTAGRPNSAVRLSSFHICMWFSLGRCFSKASGTFGSSNLPAMPLIAPYQQDNLEMKPLNHMMVAMCLASTVPGCDAEMEEDCKEPVEPPSQDSCCQENVNPLSTDCIEGMPVFW